MSTELEKITTQYRKFEQGQYVEHTQFNEFLDSFEDQDRLSRVLLSGVGVTCGLEPTVIRNRRTNQAIAVELSQGSGVTTDGDLLTLIKPQKDQKIIEVIKETYQYYQDYDNHKVRYAPFHKDDGSQIELTELLTTPSKTKIAKNGAIVDESSIIENKYLILYLESYEKDARPCKGVDCDNHGIEKVTNLRVLVTNQDGIDHIVASDTIYLEKDPRHLYARLTEIALKRPVISKYTDNIGIIRKLYLAIFRDQSIQQQITNNFKHITDFFKKENALDDTSILNVTEAFLKASEPYGFQYCYTFIKDLIDTYNEIKALIPKLTTVCFPNFNAFPKHIMLGNLDQDNKLNYRHSFYHSPIEDEQHILDQIELLINRFNDQIRRFSNFDSEEVIIKITPSDIRTRLSDKAIPFYYKANRELRSYWDFDKTKNRIPQNNLSYFENSGLVTVGNHVQKPLTYNQDHTSFYRIEGHQGKSYTEALQVINDLKFDNQLAFDVMVVSLAELDKNEDQSKAYYQDYIERHSGLEHKSGVYVGGTFIMIYESEQNPMVMADFTLPYLCCNKRIDIGLVLPVTEICQDGEPFEMTIEPFNGKVKAFVGEVEINAIELRGNQSYFNPSLVPDIYLDDIITFTVNEEAVENEIIVRSLPETNITTTITYPDEVGTTVTVTYHGLDTANEYEFDFYGNGKWEKIIPDRNGNYTKRYLFKLGSERQINAKALVINKETGCSAYQTIPISLLPDIEIISVTYTNGDCCNGLEISSVNYGERPECCIPRDSQGQTCSIPFTIVANERYTQARGRYKLSTSSTWKEFTIDVNNMRTPEVAIAGVYDLQVRIMDIYNEWTDWYSFPRFTIDECPNEAPVARISRVHWSGGSDSGSIPPEGSIDVLVEASNSIDTDGTITAYQWETRFGNESWQSHSNTREILRVTLRRIGTHYFRVRVQDNDGAWSAWTAAAQFVLSLSNQAPTARISFKPPERTSAIITPEGGQFIGATAEGSTDPDGTIALYQWETCYEEEVWKPYSETTKDISVRVTRAGRHYLRVRVQDNTGVWSAWTEGIQFDMIAAFSISPNRIEFSDIDRTPREVTINSSVPWQIAQFDSSFLTINPLRGTGTAKINISIIKNIGEDRNGGINVINDNQESITIRWFQYGPDIGIGTGGGGCFDLESNILMASGRSKKLRNILVGDELTVYSFNPQLPLGNKELMLLDDLMENAVKGTSKVVDFATKTVDEYREITLVNGEVLTITPSHPVLASRNREEVAWLLPDDLRAGAFLIDKNGRLVEIESKRTIKESLEVGLLQLESGDNYFVQGCMVHNPTIIRAVARAGERGAIGIDSRDDVVK
ncbi:Hint domain-containing protein [Aquimarina sp. 2201CG1-2-11]|uniref:Hint domain-containing protein n=1 Tax=Aquimarina discodermiae TaxID=3231043 RepID=UPI003461A453